MMNLCGVKKTLIYFKSMHIKYCKIMNRQKLKSEIIKLAKETIKDYVAENYEEWSSGFYEAVDVEFEYKGGLFLVDFTVWVKYYRGDSGDYFNPPQEDEMDIEIELFSITATKWYEDMFNLTEFLNDGNKIIMEGIVGSQIDTKENFEKRVKKEKKN